MHLTPVRFLTFAVLGVFASASSPLRGAFADVTVASGLNVVEAPPGVGAVFGGAATCVDVDGDGWPDLLIGRIGHRCALFINLRDGTFREEGVDRGLASAVSAAGFGAGDFDNDGDQDVMVTVRDGLRYQLFINDGTGHFTEEAVARGADVTVSVISKSGNSVSIVDYDRDGYLDLFVTNYLASSVLLRNRGAAAPGYFENQTTAAGLIVPTERGFAAGWADFDGDGWPDLALIADYGRSQMYWNNGNGTFTETGKVSGVALDEFGMGIAIADYDADGRLDFYVTSIHDQETLDRTGTMVGNKLYRNLGGRRFEESATPAMVARVGWAWGTAFFDADNDVDRDLVVTNGTTIGAGGDPRATPFTSALDDPTTLFRNEGGGAFRDITSGSGITDTGQGRALLVWDYDGDGDDDLLIANFLAAPILYRSDASANGNGWIAFRFRGTISNRDGVGAIVRVTSGGVSRHQVFTPTSGYIGQHESRLHFGLGSGAATTVDTVEVAWPSGIRQTLTGLARNQTHLLVEPAETQTPPRITVAPVGGTFTKDDLVQLTVVAEGDPAPVFVWAKDGIVIAGASGATLRIPRVHPFDAGRYTVTAVNPVGSVTSSEIGIDVTIDVAGHSVARWWNEFLLDAIRKDVPNPPVHARNLYHLSAAIWDAFWAYETEGWSRARPVFHGEDVTPADWFGDRAAAQHQAISHAAFRILTERFKNSAGRVRTQFGLRWLMERFGYDPDFVNTTGMSPAAVGNRIGYAVLAATINDGANEAAGYADATGYVAVNDPLIVTLPGAPMNDPSRWQPLALRYSVAQNGLPVGEGPQRFVGVNARNTTPFALVKPSPTTMAHDPGPPPTFGGETHAAFVADAVGVIAMSSMLDPTDGVMIDISPGVAFNHPLGTNAGTGHGINPATGLAYAPNVVRRGDYARVLAEFWADGPSSETPPGHWNVVFNKVSDHPLCSHRYGGVGPVLPRLEWDVRSYLALNGAVHDAACAAWTLKRQYDSARPISMIRHLAGLGQSSDPGAPAYHPLGLPLIPDLIELVTEASSAPGGRHAHLAESVGRIAIRSWRGNPADARTQIGGVDWILAENWVAFQLATFVTPAFPGYVSGHSTFSRAAAEALTLLTGSPYFPGGLSEYHFAANEYLTFEVGPTADLRLQWATYYDAADQAGLSRLFGGIHPSADDFTGRRLGSRVGLDAFLHAQALRNGAAPPRGLVNLSARGRAGDGDEVMISGFVIEGTGAQTTLVRAIGPELARYFVVNCDPDPRLELHRQSDNAILAVNDDWNLGPRAVDLAVRSRLLGAFPLTPEGRDAAELVDLPPGAYTVVNRSASPGQRGISLAEIYGESLLNLSARGTVAGGEAVVIAGFVVEGADPSPLLIRGVGPTLQGLGVPGALADPELRVYRQGPDGTNELVAGNDDWSDDARASLTASAALATHAFVLPHGSKDAALLLQLPAGIYTAVVSGVDGGEGVALVEVYHAK